MKDRRAGHLQVLPSDSKARGHLVAFHVAPLPQLLAVLLVDPLVHDVDGLVRILLLPGQRGVAADLPHQHGPVLGRALPLRRRPLLPAHGHPVHPHCLLVAQGAQEDLTFAPALSEGGEAHEGTRSGSPLSEALLRSCNAKLRQDLEGNLARDFAEGPHAGAALPPRSDHLLELRLRVLLVELVHDFDHLVLEHPAGAVQRGHALQHHRALGPDEVLHGDEEAVLGPREDLHSGGHAVLLLQADLEVQDGGVVLEGDVDLLHGVLEPHVDHAVLMDPRASDGKRRGRRLGRGLRP
mmetsp:Transcript_101391/g.246555  ORF Transcript_101391/g.246555 Transcript_101391/m.246555 type:complete len:295 (+) Transcript_101391:672-1556(+)